MTIYQILMTKYHRLLAKYYSLTTINYLRPSTSVENALQISAFMTNKANFPKAEIDGNSVFTKDYGYLWLYKSLKNKPNSNPIKANTKPIQNKSKPIQRQYKANFTYPKFELLFHLIYKNRLINWIKSRCFATSLQNSPYQYKKPAFIAVRIPCRWDSFQDKRRYCHVD